MAVGTLTYKECLRERFGITTKDGLVRMQEKREWHRSIDDWLKHELGGVDMILISPGSWLPALC